MKKMLLLWLVTVGLFAGEETFSAKKVFQVNPDANFSLDAYKGHVTLKTHNSNEIVISYRIFLEDNETRLTPEQVNEVCRAAKVNFTDTAKSVKVSVDYDSVEAFWKKISSKHQTSPTVDFDVLVPDSGAININLYKGELKLDVPSGKVKVESYKGEGYIHGVRQSLDLETYKGTFDVEVLNSCDVDIETYKGSVSVDLNDFQDFELSGKTRKGDFKFTGIDIPITQEDKESSVRYTDGQGSHKLSLDTYKGDISLNFK